MLKERNALQNFLNQIKIGLHDTYISHTFLSPLKMSYDSHHLLSSSCYRTSSRLECYKIDAIASLYLQLTNFYSANTFTMHHRECGLRNQLSNKHYTTFKQESPPILFCLIALTDPQKELFSPC